MLSGITITCFAASYAVSLGLEVLRLFFRTIIRFPVLVGFAMAGLFAHASYLVTRAGNAARFTGFRRYQAGMTSVWWRPGFWQRRTWC